MNKLGLIALVCAIALAVSGLFGHYVNQKVWQLNLELNTHCHGFHDGDESGYVSICDNQDGEPEVLINETQEPFTWN